MVRLLRTHARTLSTRRLSSALLAALLWVAALTLMLGVCLSPHADANASAVPGQTIEQSALG